MAAKDKDKPNMPPPVDQKAMAEIQKQSQTIFKAMARLKEVLESSGMDDGSFGKYIDNLKKGQKDFDQAYKGAEKSYKKAFKTASQFSDLAERMSKVSDIKLSGKNLEFILKYLKKTKISVAQLSDKLDNSLEKLDDDLECVAGTLRTLDDEQKKLIDELAGNLDDTTDAVDGLSNSLVDLVGNVTAEYGKLSKALTKTPQINFGGIKTDAKTAVQNLKSVQKTLDKQLHEMKIDIGFDSNTYYKTMGEMKDSADKIDAYETEITDILAGNSKYRGVAAHNRMKALTTSAAKEVALSQQKLMKIQEAADSHKEIIDISSGGYLALARAAEEEAELIQKGFDALKSGSLAGAFTAFKDAHKKGQQKNAAAKIMGQDSGNSKGLVALMSGFGMLTGFIGAMALLVKLFLQARDHVVEVNKGLVEGAGLAGMGIKVTSETSFNDIEKKFAAARDEITNFKGMFDFGATQGEVVNVLKALAQNGQTQEKIRAAGLNLKDATKGAFTYSQAWGKSADEVATLQGKMASNLNMSLERTESQFADITEKWQGSKISIDDFLSTVDDITTENAIFGNRITEVTKLLGQTGKNALLGSKQAISATKSMADWLDKLDRSAMASMVERVGDKHIKSESDKQMSELKGTLDKIPDKSSAEAKGLQDRMDMIDSFWAAYASGNATARDFKSLLAQLSIPRQDKFRVDILKDIAMKAEGATSEAMGKVNISKILAGGAGREQFKILFSMDDKQVEEFRKSHIGTFDQVSDKLGAVDTSIGADKKAVENANKAAKYASSLQLTTDKALQIMQEMWFVKLYGKMSGMEHILGTAVDVINAMFAGIEKSINAILHPVDNLVTPAIDAVSSAFGGDTSVEDKKEGEKNKNQESLGRLNKTSSDFKNADPKKKAAMYGKLSKEQKQETSDFASGKSSAYKDMPASQALQTRSQAMEVMKGAPQAEQAKIPKQADFMKNTSTATKMQYNKEQRGEPVAQTPTELGKINARVAQMGLSQRHETLPGQEGRAAVKGKYPQPAIAPTNSRQIDTMQYDPEKTGIIESPISGFVEQADGRVYVFPVKSDFGMDLGDASNFKSIPKSYKVGDSLSLLDDTKYALSGVKKAGGLLNKTYTRIGYNEAAGAIAAQKTQRTTDAGNKTDMPSNAQAVGDVTNTVAKGVDVLNKAGNQQQMYFADHAAGGFQVPPGFPNDTYKAGLTSEEWVLNPNKSDFQAQMAKMIKTVGGAPAQNVTNQSTKESNYNFNLKVDDSSLLRQFERMTYLSDRKKAFQNTHFA